MTLIFDNPTPAIGCGDPGDPIPFSCLFAGGSLARVMGAGDRKTCSVHTWLKIVTIDGARRAIISANQGSTTRGAILYDGNIEFHDNGSVYRSTSGTYKDTAGWMSLLWRKKSDLAIEAERVEFLINGILVSTETATTLELNAQSQFGTASEMRIGDSSQDSPFQAYMAELVFLDGIYADPTDFGRFNTYGQWVNKSFVGKGQGVVAYGTNGFHLDFADPMDLGKDVSGTGNHFTATGLTIDNQTTDTPTNNLSTFNPLARPIGGNGLGVFSFDKGNTRVSTSTQFTGIMSQTMLIPTTGRWVSACHVENIAGAGGWAVAVFEQGITGFGGNVVLLEMSGSISVSNAVVQSGLAAIAVDDIIETFVDPENRQIHFHVNGNPHGTPVSIAGSGRLLFGSIDFRDSAGGSGRLDYSTPRDGYRFLTSSNLPCPDILNPDDYFTVRLTGAGADVTDLPWDPTIHKTLVMSKRRDVLSDWRVSDTVRGNNLAWRSTIGGLEIPASLTFTPGGIDVGADTEYQGWRLDYFWRASPKSGFDIVEIDHVTGTPTTVPHAVGGVIDYAWLVPLDGGDIRVFHRSLPAGQFLRLNGGSVAGTDAGWFASTAINLTIGASMPTGRYSLPVWRAVSQFSAFVSYGGNSLVDGAFCPLDFLPRMALIKTSQAPNPHYALDTDRAPGNPITNELQPGTNGTENTITIDSVDFVSNGLKQRSSTSENNTTPNTIIPVAAWAKTPGKFARVR